MKYSLNPIRFFKIIFCLGLLFVSAFFLSVGHPVFAANSCTGQGGQCSHNDMPCVGTEVAGTECSSHTDGTTICCVPTGATPSCSAQGGTCTFDDIPCTGSQPPGTECTKNTDGKTSCCISDPSSCSSKYGSCIGMDLACGGTEVGNTDCTAGGKKCCVVTCANMGGTCKTMEDAGNDSTCDARDAKDCTSATPICCVKKTDNGGGGIGGVVTPIAGGSGLVPCGAADDPNHTGGPAEDCDFNKFITGIQTLINFLLFVIAIPLAALAFAWAGVLYMKAGTPTGSESDAKTAKGIFGSVAYGLAIGLGAWLLVSTILGSFGVANQFSQFLGK